MRPHHRIAILALALSLSSMASCEDSDKDDTDNTPADTGPYNLVVNGSGFSPHNGQTLYAAVVKVSDGSIVGEAKHVTVTDGAFSFQWNDVLVGGTAYALDYYADHNSSGACDAPPTDHVWRVSIAAVSADHTETLTHNTNFTDVCATFGVYDLTFNGTGYTPHNGQIVTAAVVATVSGAVVAGPDEMTVTDGAFAFTWPSVLVGGTAYQVHYFADHSGDGECSAPPTDHVWSVAIAAVSADVALSETHNTNFTNVCATFGAFDLSFSGTGYSPHDGQGLSVAVVRTDDGTVVVSDSVSVAGGAFSFEWPSILLEGVAYEVRYYADHNANGVCNVTPTDHSWVNTVAAVTDDVTVATTHNTNFTYVCTSFGDFDLTFSGTGYSPHNTQTLTAAVVLASDDTIVAGPESVTVAGGTFSFTWPMLLVTGESYEIHFFADHNSSGACDAPPTDHVWSVAIPAVAADVAQSETHNTSFTDVCSTF